MIIVRESFIAKPGKASALAKMMKQAWPDSVVMTDMTGTFNTVVVQTEYDDLAGFEQELKDYQQGKGKRQPLPGYADLFSGGMREIFRIW
ncbi:MAG: hypothetical protein HY340_00905 [Candidatus Kerfeldbacteria bacterium]|nr:hypothetical protein [Candidatus Kerfeldbacteria bacterium]